MTSANVNNQSSYNIYVNLEKEANNTDYSNVVYSDIMQNFGSQPLLKTPKNWLVGIERFHLNLSTLPIVAATPNAIQIIKKSDNSVVANLDLPDIYNIVDFFNFISSLSDDNTTLEYKPLIFKLRNDGRIQLEYYFNAGANKILFDQKIAAILDLPIEIITTSTTQTKITITGASNCLSRIDQLVAIQLISRQGLMVSSEIFNNSSLPILTDFIVDQLPNTSFSTTNTDTGLETNYSVSFTPRDNILYNAGNNVRFLNCQGDAPLNFINLEFIARCRDYNGNLINKRILQRRSDHLSIKMIFVNKL